MIAAALAATRMIAVPTWGNVTLLEALWLLAGLLSTWFSYLNVRDSLLDRRALKVVHDDPSVHSRHYVMIALSARNRLESQANRLFVSLLIVATGVIAVATSNPHGGATTITGLAVAICLILIAAATALRSFFDWRERNLLYEMATHRSEVLAAKLRAAADELADEA